MSAKDLCPNCVHSKTCQTVYQRLGEKSGPPVAGAAFVAFLLPFLVFIVALAVCQEFLPSFLQSRILWMFVALLSSALLGFTAMLLTRKLLHLAANHKTQGVLRGE